MLMAWLLVKIHKKPGASFQNTVECRYIAVQYKIILHSTLVTEAEPKSEFLNSQQTPQEGELWGVYCEEFGKKMIALYRHRTVLSYIIPQDYSSLRTRTVTLHHDKFWSWFVTMVIKYVNLLSQTTRICLAEALPNYRYVAVDIFAYIYLK